MASSRFTAFTLAELLIALFILGVIATFSIPKVLIAQQNQKFNAIAKETAAMLSGSYSAYQLDNAPSNTTKNGDLTPYMNYVSVETTGALTIFHLTLPLSPVGRHNLV